jgi:hypothetical protein
MNLAYKLCTRCLVYGLVSDFVMTEMNIRIQIYRTNSVALSLQANYTD